MRDSLGGHEHRWYSSMSPKIPHELLKKEFDRIGADAYLRNGFATNDPRVTMDVVLAALRATPTGGGTPAFERTLKAMLASAAPRRRRSRLLIAAYCTLAGAVVMWLTGWGFIWVIAAVACAVLLACAEVWLRVRGS